jgi:hypothetical protein
LDPLVLTRTLRHPLHVIVAGAVCAAVGLGVAGCGPVDGSANGAASGSGAEAGGQPGAPHGPVAVPTADIVAALGCPDGTSIAVGRRVDLPTARSAAVLVAHCQAAAGSPPDGVYLVADAGHGAHVTGTLVPASAQVDVSAVVRSGDEVKLTGRSYSGPDVPRCCPDVPVSRSWRLVGDRLVPQS